MLQGKKVWLIGASEGIGEALARKLADKGAQVAVSARSVDKLRAIATSLAGKGHLMLPVDVTDAATIAAAWQTLTAEWQMPDVVVYNAGTYDPMSAKAFQFDGVMRMVDTNFIGALRVLALALPAFVARNAGHIALVGSVAAYSGLPNAMGYGASKAALLHLAENMKVDLKDTAVKVQVVSPGFVKTRLTDKNTFPMPFIIEAEEAAERIASGLESDRFEIHFPRRFTLILKFLRLLPYALYFRVTGMIR